MIQDAVHDQNQYFKIRLDDYTEKHWSRRADFLITEEGMTAWWPQCIMTCVMGINDILFDLLTYPILSLNRPYMYSSIS